MPRIDLNAILVDCFGEDAELQGWLDVESALARVQARMGMIPAEAADAIVAVARVECLDREELAATQKKTSHPIIPIVRELERLAGPEHGRWVHYGATSQNIEQTGFVLCLRRAHITLMAAFRNLVGKWADAAEQHRDVVMTGRTHGQSAVPITFGFKVAGWLDESMRHLDRMSGVEKRTFLAMMGGAAGTCASFGNLGIEVQHGLAQELGLASMPLPSRAVLDHLVEYGQALTLLCGTPARAAADMFQMMKPECGEIFHDDGSVGSSTMPQKRNPILHSSTLAAWKLIRARHALLPECLGGEGEANPSSVVPLQDSLADISRLAMLAIERQTRAMDTLVVNAECMAANIDRQGKWILAEGLAMKLTDTLGRAKAHARLHEYAMQARQTGQSLEEAVLADEELLGALGESDIATLLDPASHTGQCGTFVDAAVANARSAIAPA